jgi:nucleoside-diphosphate-sugar epimerase
VPRGKEVRDESEPPTPISNYGRSKRLGEIELQKRAGKLPITVVRPGVVFGPRDPHNLSVFRSIYRARLHLVVGFRTARLSMIFAEDLARLILAAVERGETLREDPQGHYSPAGYYIACDDSDFPSYWEYGRRIAKFLDRSVFVWPLWRWVSFIVGFVVQTFYRLQGRSSLLNVDKIREAVPRSWASSCEKARRQLGFQPSQSLDARLQQTAEWYLENGEL